jgi:DNA invertase Pin-like site-specific DNA recombinase
MTNHLHTILSLNDAGHTPAAIAAHLSLSVGTVYAALRAHRPTRPRAPRSRTSEKRAMVLGLVAQGVPVARVAFLQDCSRAYVYKLLAEREGAQ